jgi:general secretion pathway protein D
VRRPIHIFLAVLISATFAMAASPADGVATVPAMPCADGIPGAPACTASKQDLKEAHRAFERGLKLQKSRNLEAAFEHFERAAQIAPRDMQYVTARELVREQLVFNHVQSGNADLTAGKQIEALAEFRTALQLDPENAFARQRLEDALGPEAPKIAAAPQVIADSGELQTFPQQRHSDFHFRGDSRGLLEAVAQAYGVDATLDDSVTSHHVRFDIENVDFATAMAAASTVTKTFWTPLDERQILIANDTPESHRSYDRMAMRSFYVPDATTPQDLNELVNAFRSLFDIRFLTAQPNTSTITVRAPRQVLDAATTFLEQLNTSRPEVILDVKTFEVSHTLTRNMGLHIPNQFNLFNIPVAALAALGGQNIQDLINQLISSGGINQAGNSAISALLAQLQGQQNGIFSQPLATFGGGLTFMGLSLGQLSQTLSLNESWVRNLDHATLRASQGKDTNFHLGTRYPILNASFAPVFNSPAIAQVIGNNSFQTPFPSFNYEDLGLTVKAKPYIHRNSDVGLQLELQLRSLGSQTSNGIPAINNREYKGSITLKDGEPAVVAGSINNTELRSLTGIPGLGNVPGLNQIMSNNTKEEDEDEILIVITPHVIGERAPESATEIWLSSVH